MYENDYSPRSTYVWCRSRRCQSSVALNVRLTDLLPGRFVQVGLFGQVDWAGRAIYDSKGNDQGVLH